MHFLQEMERSRFHEFKDKHNIKLCLTKIRLYLHCIHSICQRHVYVDTIKMDGWKASDGGCLRFSPWWCFTMFTMFHHGGVWLCCHSLVLAKCQPSHRPLDWINLFICIWFGSSPFVNMLISTEEGLALLPERQRDLWRSWRSLGLRFILLRCRRGWKTQVLEEQGVVKASVSSAALEAGKGREASLNTNHWVGGRLSCGQL